MNIKRISIIFLALLIMIFTMSIISASDIQADALNSNDTQLEDNTSDVNNYTAQ